MNTQNTSLCHNGCSDSETEMALLLLSKHEKFLQKHFELQPNRNQTTFSKWAWFTVLEAMLIASLYNLPHDNFEELLLFTVKSYSSLSYSVTQQVELETFV
ncbi:hypothetical protein [Spartinivicinus ruber]|uniref:hypothetical protein n=1 Tax=Spartinivicinus ruber TaxID=2683272 RepID=UPI0013D0F929|nr:hypothetical protein [Spartinivicinus ruber]